MMLEPLTVMAIAGLIWRFPPDYMDMGISYKTKLAQKQGNASVIRRQADNACTGSQLGLLCRERCFLYGYNVNLFVKVRQLFHARCHFIFIGGVVRGGNCV